MPFLEKQIDVLNSQLLAGPLKYKQFQGGLFGGIAKPVRVESGENQFVIMPGSIDATGKETSFVIDDTYPIQLYHKILSKNFSERPANRQYGDSANMKVETISAYLVVFSKFGRIRLTAEQLEALITMSFPDAIPQDAIADISGMTQMRVILQSSDMDMQRVFNREYQNVEYSLGVEDILFSIQYQIETVFKKGCLNICEPCETAG